MVVAAIDLSHLRPEIRELARLSVPERLARVPANRWIGYARASQAVTSEGKWRSFSSAMWRRRRGYRARVR